LARALASLCEDVAAAESSILLPVDDAELGFFASTNPALMMPHAPRVPINASFSGIAFRTGQTIAVADAATQTTHFGAVDALTKSRTREFAAIPIADRAVAGILTLVNRVAPDPDHARPFALAELRRAEAVAAELAHAFALVPGLLGPAQRPGDRAAPLEQELAAGLALLNDAERRIVRALADALVQNRGD
jgi:GAF domain-containing protein